MHDATVDRTTDGGGAIKEMSFDEIRALDAGYYWTDDDGATYPYRVARAFKCQRWKSCSNVTPTCE